MLRPIMTVLLLGVAMPATAHAQVSKGYAPPGNAAIAETTETIPGVGPTDPPGASVRPFGAPLLGVARRASLERLGTEGKALADAVDATSPARRPHPADAARALGNAGAPSAGEVLRAIARGSGEGVKGLLLPLLLLGSLVAAAVLVFQRRWAPR